MFNFLGNLMQKTPGKEKQAPQLKIFNTTVQHQHGYLMIHGFVMNETDHDISNAMAVAECFSEGGNFLKKTDMMIDEKTISPKQVSSFSLAAPNDPNIDFVRISFKYLFGKSIESTPLCISRYSGVQVSETITVRDEIISGVISK